MLEVDGQRWRLARTACTGVAQRATATSGAAGLVIGSGSSAAASSAACFSTRASVVARSRAGTGACAVTAARGLARARCLPITGTRLNQREQEPCAEGPLEPTTTPTTHHDAPSVNRYQPARPKKHQPGTLVIRYRSRYMVPSMGHVNGRMCWLCALLLSCAGTPPKQPPLARAACSPPGPRGSAAELRTPIGASEGPWIDAPEYCYARPGFDAGAFIRIHGRGSRQFARFRGCKSEPEGPDGCPVIDLDAFALVVSRKVSALSRTAGGAGMGVCSDVLAVPSARRDRAEFSTSVSDWQDADAAIRIVSGLLESWHIGDAYGLSVRGLTCAVEESKGSAPP